MRLERSEEKVQGLDLQRERGGTQGVDLRRENSADLGTRASLGRRMRIDDALT